MNRVALHLATGSTLGEGRTEWEVFIGRRWDEGAVSKRRAKIVSRPGHLFWGEGEGNGKDFMEQMASSAGWGEGWKAPTWQITSLVLTGNIPEGLIKIMFLGKFETAVKSGIRCKFGITGFSTSDAIWPYSFLSNTSLNSGKMKGVRGLFQLKSIWTQVGQVSLSKHCFCKTFLRGFLPIASSLVRCLPIFLGPAFRFYGGSLPYPPFRHIVGITKWNEISNGTKFSKWWRWRQLGLNQIRFCSFSFSWEPFFKKKIFIYFRLCWVFIAMRAFF